MARSMPGGLDVAAGATYMLPKQRPLNTLEDSILRTIEVRAAFEQDCPHSAMFLEELTQEGFAAPWSLADDCCDFVENSGFMATAQDLSALHPLSDGDKELVPCSCCDCQKDQRRALNSANHNGQHVLPSTPVERRPAEGLKFPRSRARQGQSRTPSTEPPAGFPGGRSPRSVPAFVSPAGLSAAS